MNYQELYEFIEKRMRMSHIYQPVVLISLLKNGGKRHEKELAKDLLIEDESQIDYYKVIAKNMVGRVLRKHEVVEWNRQSKDFTLLAYPKLSADERKQLIDLCGEKLDDFLRKRGDTVFSHRQKSSGYISGTIRYEILKLAKYRCELCGISADEKALEVDHIVPRNKGGSDDYSNLQALCYSCNAMKRDRDDTDFRNLRDLYRNRDKECAFCNISESRVLSENELAYAIEDQYPVTEKHTLIIPRRHVDSYFELGRPEINALNQLIHTQRTKITSEDSSVEGFNMGVNDGKAAGQTVFHCHAHLIPRRVGDTQFAEGGVRNVIPGKGQYTEV